MALRPECVLCAEGSQEEQCSGRCGALGLGCQQQVGRAWGHEQQRAAHPGLGKPGVSVSLWDP